jgi:hypothetical protein
VAGAAPQCEHIAIERFVIEVSAKITAGSMRPDDQHYVPALS